MSVRGYAAARGVSPGTVRYHVECGTIRLIDGKVDRLQADRAWAVRRRAPYMSRDAGRQSATAKIRMARAKLGMARDHLDQLRERYADRADAIAKAEQDGAFVLDRLAALPAERAIDVGVQLGIEPAAARDLLTTFVATCLAELGDLPKQLAELTLRA